jgi:hypothetical protein
VADEYYDIDLHPVKNPAAPSEVSRNDSFCRQFESTALRRVLRKSDLVCDLD